MDQAEPQRRRVRSWIEALGGPIALILALVQWVVDDMPTGLRVLIWIVIAALAAYVAWSHLAGYRRVIVSVVALAIVGLLGWQNVMRVVPTPPSADEIADAVVRRLPASEQPISQTTPEPVAAETELKPAPTRKVPSERKAVPYQGVQAPKSLAGLDLQIDVDGLPYLMRTNHGKAVQLIPINSKDEKIEVIFSLKLDTPDPRNIPHNLWMIVLSNVTIWNKSQRRVSLQFELKTTVKGPVRLSELSMNMSGLAAEFQKLATLDRIPITLQEHGPGRAASRIPNVLTGGQEKYPYLQGPLDIDPLNHAQGVLAFFYHQLDGQEARIDFSNGTLVIHDRLSDATQAFELAKLRQK